MLMYLIRCTVWLHSSHFLEKKDMMFPWPLGAAFLFFAAGGATATLTFLGSGSSSEKDSQPGSSRVTANDVSFELERCCRGKHTEITFFVLDRLLLHYSPSASSAATSHDDLLFGFFLLLRLGFGIRFICCGLWSDCCGCFGGCVRHRFV